MYKRGAGCRGSTDSILLTLLLHIIIDGLVSDKVNMRAHDLNCVTTPRTEMDLLHFNTFCNFTKKQCDQCCPPSLRVYHIHYPLLYAIDKSDLVSLQAFF